VRWAHDPTTKVNVIAGSIRMLLELLAVRWNAWKGRYPFEPVWSSTEEVTKPEIS